MWPRSRRKQLISRSVPARSEMLADGGACEMVADQSGHPQQGVPGPVVGHDVLRLPGGVTRDQNDVADQLAAHAGGVVLQEAVLAVRTGVVELLGVIERADMGDD